MLRTVAAALLCFAAAAVPAQARPVKASRASAGPELRINQLQVLGSHNSYRPLARPATQKRLDARLGVAARGLDYGHPPLADQLALGLRQFEFDPYVDRDGGLYALSDADPQTISTMRRPGLKVLHMPVIDQESHCLTLKACFSAIAAWSRSHPGHEVLFITVDTKDAPSLLPEIASPTLYGPRDLDEIDATARAAFGKGLIEPDQVRGKFASLRDAVLARNWPTVRAARGKVMIILDSNPRIADLYRQGHPGLAGRALFGVYPEDQPEASVFNIQEPVKEAARIRHLVERGFIVRSRADANTLEARTHDTKRLAAAVEAGAQIISTDYYPGAPDPLGLKFTVRLADGFHQRNAVVDPAPAR